MTQSRLSSIDKRRQIDPVERQIAISTLAQIIIRQEQAKQVVETSQVVVSCSQNSMKAQAAA